MTLCLASATAGPAAATRPGRPLTAQSDIGTVRMPAPGVGVQPPEAFPLFDALEELLPTASTVWRPDRASEGPIPRRPWSSGCWSKVRNAIPTPLGPGDLRFLAHPMQYPRVGIA